MARSTTIIYNQIIASKNAEAALNDLNSTSQTAIWRLWAYITAVSINIFEQLLDVFKSDIEGIILNNYVGTPKWIKTKCEEFQYSATIPQVLTLDTSTTTIKYTTIDADLQIISRVAVSTDLNKNVNIKVAKEEPPTVLAAGEETALNAYLLELMPAGVTYNVINAVSDKLYIAGEIFYDGQYASTIQASVEAAINTYLSTLDFNGAIKIIDLQLAIRSVTGVKDIDLSDVWLRADAIPLANGFKMIDSETLTIISQVPVSGYAVEETTASNTWGDKIVYTIE